MMAYVEARHYSSASEMLAAAKAIRDRLYNIGKRREADRAAKHSDLRCEFVEDMTATKRHATTGMTREALKRAKAIRESEMLASRKKALADMVLTKKESERQLREKAKQRVAENLERKRLEKEQKRKALKRAEWMALNRKKHDEMYALVDMYVMELCADSEYLYSEIIGANHRKDLVAERYRIMKAVAEMCPDVPIKRIGIAFGGKDHTCVRNALIRLGCPSRGYPMPEGNGG